MRVVFKTPLLHAIIEAMRDADENLRQIDCIELSVKEVRALRREAEDIGMFRPTAAKPPNLLDPGHHITAGDHATVYGVKVVCNETAPCIELNKAVDFCLSVTRS